MTIEPPQKFRPRGLFRAWLRAILICIGILIASILIGKAADCNPGQRDGQCGLVTFMAVGTGACIDGVILLTMIVKTIVQFVTRHQYR